MTVWMIPVDPAVFHESVPTTVETEAVMPGRPPSNSFDAALSKRLIFGPYNVAGHGRPISLKLSDHPRTAWA